ncbi:MAG: Fe3+-siderophores ABC transporter protein, partial [Bdellovibrionales bacterium]|nr:helical backbone metal receptor [Bdellovibrionales bacterium]NQZ19021.1 Fe3+-siderophores ABC transporter protein [Bdellovibrionales bacterium]
PSWTETLVEWGVEVVGRTRYCIHPEDQVDQIPIIGGTKDTRWEKLHKLKADLIIVDKEENKRTVLEKAKVPLMISHVESLHDMPRELQKFLDTFAHYGAKASILQKVYKDKQRWEEVLNNKQEKPKVLPSVFQWVNKTETETEIDKLEYIIWKEPWMKVSKQTFIGSVLTHLGYDIETYKKKYQEFDLEKEINPSKTYLFSSEPYEFNKAQEIEFIKSLNVPSAIVDGESYSWFGSRSLAFLESLQL